MTRRNLFRTLLGKLNRWYTVYRRFGVTPWQYEADLRAVRKSSNALTRKES